MARSKEMDLTTGNPFRSLLKFAIPVILGSLLPAFFLRSQSPPVYKKAGTDSPELQESQISAVTGTDCL